MKYEGLNSYQSKDMANLKVFVDKQTNGQAKNYMLHHLSMWGGGGIKKGKCWLTPSSLFPKMFSKGFFFKVIKN